MRRLPPADGAGEPGRDAEALPLLAVPPRGAAAVVYVPAGSAIPPCPFPCGICRRAGRQPGQPPEDAAL